MSDTELLHRLDDLAIETKAIEATLLEHLAEFVRRQLHLTLGLRSVFDYATRVLGFSRDSSQKRIRAAKALLVRPELAEHLRTGRLTMSSLAVLAPAVHRPGLVEQALGKSKRDVEVLVRQGRGGKGPSDNKDPRSPTKVERAQQLLRRAGHDLDSSQVIDRALDLLIDQLESGEVPSSLGDDRAQTGLESSDPLDSAESRLAAAIAVEPARPTRSQRNRTTANVSDTASTARARAPSAPGAPGRFRILVPWVRELARGGIWKRAAENDRHRSGGDAMRTGDPGSGSSG